MIGDDWVVPVRWTAGSPGTPVDLDGFSVRGWLYRAFFPQPVPVDAVIHDQDTESTRGRFTITIPKAVTSTLKPDPLGTYGTSLSIAVTDPAGRTKTHVKLPILADSPRFAETFTGYVPPTPPAPATIPGQIAFGASTLTITADAEVGIFTVAEQGPMGDVTPAAIAAKEAAEAAAAEAATYAGMPRLGAARSNTTYTVSDADGGFCVPFTSDLPITVTVPPNLNVAGVMFRQGGSGQITFLEGAGVTVEPPEGLLRKTAGKGHFAVLFRLGDNSWALSGGLDAI